MKIFLYMKPSKLVCSRDHWDFIPNIASVNIRQSSEYSISWPSFSRRHIWNSNAPRYSRAGNNAYNKNRTIIHLLFCIASWPIYDGVIKRRLFCVTGPLWGEPTGHRRIPLRKASNGELWYFLSCANGSTKSRYAGDIRRNGPHCDVTVMKGLSY